jgi:DNA-binding PucR family transcriptional regulator
VRHQFGTFFDSVRTLYNLAFFKEEKGYRAEAVKKYADELFEANRISEYVRSIIGGAIQKFALLSPVKLKEMKPTKLEQLSKWINISISDINGEINDLMSK